MKWLIFSRRLVATVPHFLILCISQIFQCSYFLWKAPWGIAESERKKETRTWTQMHPIVLSTTIIIHRTRRPNRWKTSQNDNNNIRHPGEALQISADVWDAWKIIPGRENALSCLQMSLIDQPCFFFKQRTMQFHTKKRSGHSFR